MNYAVIDLGSNTIHLLVYGLEEGKAAKIFSEKETVGLVGYVSDGVMNDDGIQKACETVNRLKEIALETVELSNIHLFATASLREIKNRSEAISVIASKTSLIPDVLCGEEEAMFGFMGASGNIDFDNGMMVDIGGASTELVLFENKTALKMSSIPVGSLTMYNDHVRGTVPTSEERECIERAVSERLSALEWTEGVVCKHIIGIGGTVRSFLKLLRSVHDLEDKQRNICSSYVEQMLEMMSDHENNDIYEIIRRTIPERVLTIFPGLVILQHLIERFGCETITVSKHGIRDGYMLNRVLK
ncbi:MAG: hypothetical protein FWD92_05570 [Methanomassiliicoccaceae archaeon]|nr:hypothetical protein [Methanomassiliicoccaceae archaeon]